MRKVKNNKYRRNNRIISTLIFTVVIFMGIGYAQVNSTMLEFDGESLAKSYDEVYITTVKYLENENSLDTENIDVSIVNETIVNSTVTLDNTDISSSATLEITVYNASSKNYTFVGTIYDADFYDNDNITFTLSGLNKDDIIEPNSYLTFFVTFSYKDTITSNVLNSIIDYRFEERVWQQITNYGMSKFEIINSSDGKFITVNYEAVPAQYEKINLPLNNLEVGELYQLTFTTWNDNVIITDKNSYTLIYGCTVMEVPNNDYLDPKKLIGYDGYNSGYLWKTMDTGKQTVTLSFKATQETMYWIWDLSGILDETTSTLHIENISVEKSNKREGAYVDVPSTTIYQKESVATEQEKTITVQKGTYITKTDYDSLVVKLQTAAGFEFINIPIVGLTIGDTYTVNFSNLTTDAEKVNLRYGAKVQANKQEGGGQLISASDYNITDLSKVNDGSITFTATASTMYLVWDCGGLKDSMWSNINIYNIELLKN